MLAGMRDGHTLKVVCDSSEATLEGWIKPDANLDGRFTLVCAETGERLTVNGWLFTIEQETMSAS
jgi:TusA-related sulfurtransferase